MSCIGLVMFSGFSFIILQSSDQNRLLTHVQARQNIYFPPPNEVALLVILSHILHHNLNRHTSFQSL